MPCTDDSKTSDDAKAIEVLTCLVAKREPSITPELGAVIFADLCAMARASDPASEHRAFQGCQVYVDYWFNNNEYFTFHDYWEFLGYPIADSLVDDCR